MSKHILMIGINSRIAKAVSTQLQRNGWIVFGTTRKITERDNSKIFFLDLLNPQEFVLPDNIKIDVVLFCASITKLKECCDNESLSKKINVESQIEIAKKLKSLFDPFMIFISSSAVFSGNTPLQLESDSPSPRNFYGQCKADAENGLSGITEKLAIIRCPKVLSADNSPLKEWISQLGNKEKIHALSDLSVCPISINLLVKAIYKLCDIKRPGVYHLSGNEDITYSDLAHHLARIMHHNENFVVSEYGVGSLVEKKYSPEYTSLNMRNSQRYLLLGPVSCHDVLRSVIDSSTPDHKN